MMIDERPPPSGISLRDWFAGLFAVEFLRYGLPEGGPPLQQEKQQVLCSVAYLLADQMLLSRGIRWADARKKEE